MTFIQGLQGSQNFWNNHVSADVVCYAVEALGFVEAYVCLSVTGQLLKEYNLTGGMCLCAYAVLQSQKMIVCVNSV